MKKQENVDKVKEEKSEEIMESLLDELEKGFGLDFSKLVDKQYNHINKYNKIDKDNLDLKFLTDKPLDDQLI